VDKSFIGGICPANKLQRMGDTSGCRLWWDRNMYIILLLLSPASDLQQWRCTMER